MKKHSGSMLAYLNDATRAAAQKESVYEVELIDAEKIVPNEKNFYSIEGVEEMANSLAVSDHMPPLEVVANDDGTYRLISGERRLSATLCRIRRGEMEKAQLPCHVLPAFTAKGALTADQVEMLHIVLANNYRQKTALDQLNEVKALEPIAQALYKESRDQAMIEGESSTVRFRTFFARQILEISEGQLQRLQTLTKLTDEAQKAYDQGLIGKSVAMLLAPLDSYDQDEFIRLIKDGTYGGTVADVERWKAALAEEDGTEATEAADGESKDSMSADTEGNASPAYEPQETQGEDAGEKANTEDACDAAQAHEAAEEAEAFDAEECDADEDEADDAPDAPYEAKWEARGQTRLFDSVPEHLTPEEAEEDGRRWVAAYLEQAVGDLQTKIDALEAAGRTVEAARWGVRLSSLKLVIETIR